MQKEIGRCKIFVGMRCFRSHHNRQGKSPCGGNNNKKKSGFKPWITGTFLPDPVNAPPVYNGKCIGSKNRQRGKTDRIQTISLEGKSEQHTIRRNEIAVQYR